MAKYRWRTWLRRHSPWWLVNRGFAAKGKRDCRQHEMYRADEYPNLQGTPVVEYRCYHCEPGVQKVVQR